MHYCQTESGSVHSLRQPEKANATLSVRDLRREPDRLYRRSDLTPRSHHDESNFLQTVWSNQRGQDIAEYAVILALILVLVVDTKVRLEQSN